MTSNVMRRGPAFLLRTTCARSCSCMAYPYEANETVRGVFRDLWLCPTHSRFTSDCGLTERDASTAPACHLFDIAPMRFDMEFEIARRNVRLMLVAATSCRCEPAWHPSTWPCRFARCGP